jgi:putative peptide zinc metalloprotease protein
MASVDSLLTARPRLRPEVVIGPGLRRGPTVTHHVKDPSSGRYFQVGARESFLMSRLDGRATLAEIGAAYAGEFHRRLDAQRWGQILGMLAGRQLLSGTDPTPLPGGPAAPPLPGGPAAHRGRQSLLRYRLSLVNPDRFFGRIAPRLRWLFSPYFVLPALVAVGVVETVVVANAGRLFTEARGLWRQPGLGAASFAIVWLSLAVHEAAHGLTCKHFGGSAPEIGVLWRFPLIAPYCDATDVVLFHRARHRVATAGAGAFASLLLLLPVAPIWATAPVGSPQRQLTASVLLFGSMGAWLTLVPFLQLDGYFMLSHALGMHYLRVESYRFWRHLIWRRAAPATRYARRDARIYAWYGVASLLFDAAAAAWMGVLVFTMLRRLAGPVGAAAVLVVGVGAVIAVRATIARRRVPAPPPARPRHTHRPIGRHRCAGRAKRTRSW